MKLKLTLSILFLFGMLFQTASIAQDLTQFVKSRTVDSEYLSASDALAIRQQLKTQQLSNKKTFAGQVETPYPIIFIHGLNSNSSVWVDLGTQFISNGLNYGGEINFCLNYDENNYTSNKLIYPTSGADIAYYTDYIVDLNVGDFYLLNFDIDKFGRFRSNPNFSDVLSNEAAIAKQGVALKIAIQMVLQKTGKDKVILMGHSMGGLASREYLQNPQNWVEPNTNHHVAKLVTTGTPHGGYTGTNVESVTEIDGQSEAYRDLRKEYSNTSNGVFLYGGIENSNTIGTNFYNNDINCNGNSNDNTTITGLNQKGLYSNLDYSYIVGVCTNCFLLQGTIEGDGIVRSVNANLSNFYTLPTPKNEFIYTASANSIVIGLHSDLPKAIPVNIQGLDEPNEYNLAYGVEFGKTYKGFMTVQPIGGYSSDIDDFTFNVVGTSQINVNIVDVSLANLMANIVDINGNSFGVFNSNGTNSISFSKTLTAGKYYLEIYGTPTTTSYLSPYTFTLTNTTLSTDDLELSLPLIVFPNPTTSKVFFDNSNYNFENVSVVNSFGQEVSKFGFSTFSNNQEIDLSKFQSGVYILKFSNHEVNKTIKLIKQ
jgi:triacylglycerol esterase/lipase EstA (alpha/beta hydrolase family)